ncbi:MAG TPA: hypothetical protein VN256_02505 [Pyrinomonadaceae bacterium]|nr:hypothetical protein [Pyrinomonadaceae bacterium]
MNSKLRAVLIGGVVMGLLSGLPYVSLGNLACCLWVVLGGGLATYLYIKQSPTPVSMGEGALLGLLAGLVGAAIRIVVGVPISILTGYPEGRIMLNLMERLDADKAELYRQAFEEMTARPFFEQFAGAVFSLQTLLGIIITLVFAVVGGLLAAPLFEKRKADAGGPPPPPPYYGGTPGPTYAPPPPPPPGDYGPSA